MNKMSCDFQTINDQRNNTGNGCSCVHSAHKNTSCGCQADRDDNNNCDDNCETNDCYCQIAIANVPMQQWKGTYPVEKGFMRGTIFQELDLPFYGRRNKR